MITIKSISPDQASELCRQITADLPEFFGLPKENEHYAEGVRSRDNLAAKIDTNYVALISLDFPYPGNAKIYWMGVMRQHHGTGVGRQLAKAAFDLAKKMGASTITVETLAPSEADENYLRSYKFYESLGFRPLFNLKPTGYEWTMVYMVKVL